MGKWTNWTKIAKYDEYFLDGLTYDGPCCYELGIRQFLIEEILSVYVGETSNERKRISAYAVDGSHLRKLINRHLKAGHALYFRSQAKRTKSEAKRMQDSLLSNYKYEWNNHFN